MASILMQKDLVVTLKKETCLNVEILSKVQPMSLELSRLVLKENALEKPTQILFYQLSHYLVSVIDVSVSASLPWPLYDTKTERAYRNELSSFISDYSSKGLLSPVMSSYLVNPGCYKVTMLIFQLSQLAVQKVLCTKIKKESHQKLYNDITKKLKSQEKEGFMDQIEKETNIMQSNIYNYLPKREVSKKIAELFRNKILKMEARLESLKAQKFLNDLVDGFVSKNKLDETTKAEILEIKNIQNQSNFFDKWLLETDRQIDEMESKWNEKVSPFLSLCKNTQTQTQSLISRCTGEADRTTYMVEYNHKTDFICTKDLQNQVNSQQKYILKNIVKEEKLNFPNLIRGFLIAISFVLKNTEISDDVYKFNKYLEGGRRNYSEIVLQMRDVMERVMNGEAKLQPSPVYHQSISLKDMPDIPPLPDLSDLCNIRELQCQTLFDTFNPPKHQFNLHRQTNFSFAKPVPKSLFITPFCKGTKDDFVKSLISYGVSSYDRPNLNVSQNLNITVAQNHRSNETISECTSGFTKQQILRLLTTKKSGSFKKLKPRTDRSNININKRGLFNESINTSNESNSLFRSYSSPNLYENREPLTRIGRRKLSIMNENSPSLLEVSGIAALDKDSIIAPPSAANSFMGKTANLPIIAVTPVGEKKFNDKLQEFNVDLHNIDDHTLVAQKSETPNNNTQLIKKTSSLEKIINRFKKVRATVLTDKSIAEEKENINIVPVNRVLLPDLLSPSCSVLSQKSDTEYLDQVYLDLDKKVRGKPRESLGTALGVDQSFLDQCDLIDNIN